MTITHITKLKKTGVKWVKENPEEALLCLIAFFLGALVFAAASVFFSTRSVETIAPEPLAPPPKWKFVERVKAGGGQVCDLYQRAEITQVRCYGQNRDGTWSLKNVF